MFGDAGHGLLLSLAGIWLVLRKGNLAQVAPILLISGLSATCFGLLYGVVFGQPLMPPLWLRPMESIIELLGYTVAGGILLLNVGFVTNMIAAWRKRDWYRLFLDSNGVAGFWLYWALLGGALATWLHVPVPSLVLKLLIIVPALLLFLREPLSNLVTGRRPFVEGGWGGYLVLAFFELFEALLSYISNSLSFVRLGAFAVAHEGLSQVIFILAGLSGSLGWVVIVLGTLFLIGFEGLIVAIQTVRLEYYEFFGKFYRGNGHAFAPFRLLDNDPT
jgi:V/A-type H+-transporting ATPase subunit I